MHTAVQEPLDSPTVQQEDRQRGSDGSSMAKPKRGLVASNNSRQRFWGDLSTLQQQQQQPLKQGSNGSDMLAPILVSCAGSDEGDGSGSFDHLRSGGASPTDDAACCCGGCEDLLQQPRTSIASTLDGHDGSGSRIGEAVPATTIAAADVAAGCFKTGVRYSLETAPHNCVLRALDAFLAMSSMFGYTATILLIMVLGATAWATSCWPLGIFITSLVLSVFLPPAPLLWEGFQHSTLVSSWRRYFQFSFACDSKLDQDGRYIFAAFPHGVFPVSELLCISAMLKMWPRLRVYSICASSVFSVPVWRHILAWTGARPATAGHFRSLLQRGSVSLVPGGIAEMFLWEEHREVIKIRDRKGFVRIAVESGTPLVPVFHFGNSKLFSWVAPAWLEGVSRRARMAVGYPLGRWGTLMPVNAPLFMAIGSPIPVPHIPRRAPGFDAAVDTAHAQLVAALEELYHKYKGLYGWQDRELVIT